MHLCERSLHVLFITVFFLCVCVEESLEDEEVERSDDSDEEDEKLISTVSVSEFFLRFSPFFSSPGWRSSVC